MEFSRQEYWRELLFPSLGDLLHTDWTQVSCIAGGLFNIWATLEALVITLMLLLLLSRFSRVRLCATPLDGSPPGSPIPGILQARTLEWVVISFSNASKWKGKVKSLSRVWLFATSWTAAYQAPPSMGFSRQEYWVGGHCLLHTMMLTWPKTLLALSKFLIWGWSLKWLTK